MLYPYQTKAGVKVRVNPDFSVTGITGIDKDDVFSLLGKPITSPARMEGIGRNGVNAQLYRFSFAWLELVVDAGDVVRIGNTDGVTEKYRHGNYTVKSCDKPGFVKFVEGDNLWCVDWLEPMTCSPAKMNGVKVSTVDTPLVWTNPQSMYENNELSLVGPRKLVESGFTGFCDRKDHPEFSGWCGGLRSHRRGCPSARV